MSNFLKLFETWRTGWRAGRSPDSPTKSPEELHANLERIPDDLGPVGAPAPLSEFVAWFIEHGERDDLTNRKLWLEYGDFCLATHTKSLSWGQFFRRIPTAGFQRYRESIGQRRWLYRLQTANVIPLATSSQGASGVTRKASTSD